jgi:uncharacterized membrane protein
VTRPRLLLLAATAAFAGGFSALSTLQHRAFWSGRFDLGNLVQAVWSTAHGRALDVTDLEGEQISRLGAHTDPLVIVLAPLWHVWPDASLLLVAQATAVGAGAAPVFLLGRKHLGSEWAGLGCALAYLLYPPTQWLVVDDFHPVAFATPLLLAAIWFLDEDRLWAFAAVAAAACLTKEQVGLAVAALGAWYALARGRRRAGTVIAVSGAAAALLAVTVVVPHFAPGGGSPFEGRYAAVGGSPGGVVRTAVTDPGALVAAVTEGRDLAYLLDLVLPLLALPLLAPGLALTAAPEILLNVLSGTVTQTSIRFHYSAAAIPSLVAAAIFGVARLRRAGAVTRALVVAVLVAGVVLGPLPVWRHVPLGSDVAAREHLVGAHAAAAARAVELIPPGAPVSATNTLGAHLSERRRVFSFPVLGEAKWVAVDRQRPSYRDAAVAPARFARALGRLRRDPRWAVVFDEDGLLVLHRTSPPGI